MASKGQKFKKYPSKSKNKILKEYLDGLGGECSLAKKHGLDYLPKKILVKLILVKCA